MLTDIHTHSAFSADGETALAKMLARARSLGVAYYGVSEHFDYDYLAEGILAEGKPVPMVDAPAYFAEARRLQAQYAPSMRVAARMRRRASTEGSSMVHLPMKIRNRTRIIVRFRIKIKQKSNN